MAWWKRDQIEDWDEVVVVEEDDDSWGVENEKGEGEMSRRGAPKGRTTVSRFGGDESGLEAKVGGVVSEADSWEDGVDWSAGEVGIARSVVQVVPGLGNRNRAAVEVTEIPRTYPFPDEVNVTVLPGAAGAVAEVAVLPLGAEPPMEESLCLSLQVASLRESATALPSPCKGSACPGPSAKPEEVCGLQTEVVGVTPSSDLPCGLLTVHAELQTSSSVLHSECQDAPAWLACSSLSKAMNRQESWVCAICHCVIPLADTALVKGCAHPYCANCILQWCTYKEYPWCPQCRLPFDTLSLFKALDGSLSDTMQDESVCLLLRAPWYTPVEFSEEVEVEEEFGDEDFDEDEEYYRSTLRIGNRRWGENGFVRGGRMQARVSVSQGAGSSSGPASGCRTNASSPPVSTSAQPAGSAHPAKDPGPGTSSAVGGPSMGRRAKRAQKRQQTDKDGSGVRGSRGQQGERSKQGQRGRQGLTVQV